MSTPRMRALVVATACIAGTSLLSTASASTSAGPGPAHTAASATQAAVAGGGRPSASGATGLSTLGLGGWKVASSDLVPQTGEVISTPGFSTDGWLSVTPDDAGAPGTEIEALVQNGACPDVFFSTNIRKCFGYTTSIGPVTSKKFAVPWWFRTNLTPNLRPGQKAKLIINGVVGEAGVWVNGRKVASATTVQGYATRFIFDITSLIRPGTNSLALAVHPNNPLKMLTLDFVDWTQIPPDQNTGIQFPIQLQISDALGIGNAHVLQNNAPDLSRSALTVKADVTNTTTMPQRGLVSATITPPGGGGVPIQVQQSVSIPANTSATVVFDPSRYSRLTISQPRVWWPYQMGGQPLYQLSAAVSQPGVEASVTSETFGIRTITSHLTAPSKMAVHGVRVFSVNGRTFVVRGGGWGENLFLHYSAQDLANQISLIKSMGLNAIRTEGHDMPDNFYQQMDRAGIMIDGGFQCCDFWEPSSPSSITPQEYALFHLSALTIGQRLRNHPSVINYSWSDNAPFKLQEKVVLDGFSEADFQDPIISSAEYKSSPILGPSGEKEGPYDWVPPSYWYDTTHANPGDSSQTNVGGSWAFDSEQSAGNTVPTLDSIRRFMSAKDQAELWQNPSFNQYHANYEPGHNGYAFGTLYNLDAAIAKRYGFWSSLDQYVELGQLQNYEDTRSQFEAFIDHSTNNPTPSTGTIYWQLNKGWPTLLWALYNYDYDQAGAYFGAKKANESVHVLYAYDNNTVTVDNLTGATVDGLSVEAKVYDLNGNVLDDQVVGNITLPSQAVRNAVIGPRVPATTAPPTPAKTYFVELIMKRNGVAIDRNVYWHSTQKDIVNWPATVGNPQATMNQYANMRALQSLPQATATATADAHLIGGGGPGSAAVTHVKITNTSSTPSVGFFLRADVRRGNADGTVQPGDNAVLPITWSDNDITLWPGETETLTASYDSALLHGATPVVSVFGFNVPRFKVPAPLTPAGVPYTAAAGGGAPRHAGDASVALSAGWAWIPERIGAEASSAART